MEYSPNFQDDYCQNNNPIEIEIKDISADYLGRRMAFINTGQVKKSVEVVVAEQLPSIPTRIASFIRNFTDYFVWPSKPEMGERQKAMREISLKSVKVGCEASFFSITDGGLPGLDKTGMQTISGVTNKIASFFTAYYKEPNPFINRKSPKIHEPSRMWIGAKLEELYSDEIELHIHTEALCGVFFDRCLEDFFTPENFTNALCGFIFNYSENKKNVKSESIDPSIYAKKHPNECDELGAAIFSCVDTLRKASNMGMLKKGILAAGTFFGSSFKRSVGAFIFATFDATLKSEGSSILDMMEMWLKEMEKPKEKVDEKGLREKLHKTILKDMSRFVKYAIDQTENENESKNIKKFVETTIAEIAPMIVNLVWDKTTNPIAQLLLYEVPSYFVRPNKPKSEDIKSIKPLSYDGFQKFGALLTNSLQDYLLTPCLGPSMSKWEPILICLIKEGIRKGMAAIPIASSPNASHENTLQLGYLFAAFNAFLQKAIKNNYHFYINNDKDAEIRTRARLKEIEFIERPMKMFLFELIQKNFREKRIQSEGTDVLLGLVNTCIKIIVDPVLITNLILKNKLSKQKFPEVKVAGEDIPGYTAVGHEAVRLLRTILAIGNKNDTMSNLDILIAAIANTICEGIGSKLAQGIRGAAASNDCAFINIIENMLWGMNEEKKSEAIFFKDWIDDKMDLQRALKDWIENELKPFILLAIKDVPGISWMSGKLLTQIPMLTEKMFKILWDEDNIAIRVLIIQYLLPIYIPQLRDKLLIQNKP